MSKRSKSKFTCILCENNNYRVVHFKKDYNGEQIMECISDYAEFSICTKCMDRIVEIRLRELDISDEDGNSVCPRCGSVKPRTYKRGQL